jgi:hypothetical protein
MDLNNLNMKLIITNKKLAASLLITEVRLLTAAFRLPPRFTPVVPYRRRRTRTCRVG